MPDIDMDFGDTRRGEVVDYVRRKYGDDHVAQIVTFGTMAARGAIRDVGRALNMTYADCDVIAKLVPGGPGNLHITLDDALKLARAARKVRERRAGEKSSSTRRARLEGCRATPRRTPRAWSSPSAPVVDYVPLATNDDAVVCQYVMTTLEELGASQNGLPRPAQPDGARRRGQDRAENAARLQLADIPENDPETYEMLAAGKTFGRLSARIERHDGRVRQSQAAEH